LGHKKGYILKILIETI